MNALAAWLAAPRGPLAWSGESSLPRALLPGSFNPLHAGHCALAHAAERVLNTPVGFEVSVENVDKPRLSAEMIERRAHQFSGVAPLWLTAAPTFLEKAALFPGCAFVIGTDTALRLIDPRYADGTLAGRDRVFNELLALGTKFIVGGRCDATGSFCLFDPDCLGPRYAALFEALPESAFRCDLSSTTLRADLTDARQG